MNVSAERFAGVTVALVTPFREDGALDEEALCGLVEWHVERGTDVVLVAGTTGESPTLTEEELRRLTRLAVESAAGRIPVLCGTGSNSTARSVAATRAAREAGADGVLLVGPYYNKPSQEGMFRHFQAIAASTDLPVLLYNVPGRTGANLEAETTLRLAAIENIVGIKEASGNLVQAMRILQHRPEGFLVLSGDDALGLPLLAMGGEGIVSVAANLVPREMSRLVRAARAGNWEEARRLHYRLLDLMEVNFISSNPGPVKAALARMGRIRESYRLPLVEIEAAHRERLEKVLERLELI